MMGGFFFTFSNKSAHLFAVQNFSFFFLLVVLYGLQNTHMFSLFILSVLAPWYVGSSIDTLF